MSEKIAWSERPKRRAIFLRTAADILFALLTRRDVSGLENIPAKGPCLLITNHLSNFDPPLIFAVIHRPDLTGLAAANYREHLFYRLVVEGAGCIWIRRGESDRQALKTALAALEKGWIVVVVPEGGRSPTHALRRGKPGPAFLAARANVPIVPMGLTHTERLGEALMRLRRITLTIRVGKPFMLPPLDETNQKQQLEARTETMMCHIAALLPPEYRGVYAEHPELTALVQQPRS